MAGTTKFQRAKNVLKESAGQILSLQGIEYIIKTRLSSESEEYLKLMISTGLIKGTADSKFEILFAD